MRALISQNGGAESAASETPKTAEPDGATAAEYIADLSESLARTAHQNGLPVLAHLLEMAREEAAMSAAKKTAQASATVHAARARRKFP